jgi:small subunit ribosomal protein S18
MSGETDGRIFVRKSRPCPFCTERAGTIDYKDASKLSRYISVRGKIESRRRTNACAKHQRRLARAIKRARFLALLPYAPSHIWKTGGVGLK